MIFKKCSAVPLQWTRDANPETFGKILRCWKRHCNTLANEDRHANVQVVIALCRQPEIHSGLVLSALGGRASARNVTRKGMAVNCGQTPTKALGVTDQHSQLQLYTEGPFDKVVTFIKVEKFRNEVEIAHGCEEFKDVAFLGGKTLNQLLDAELQGTEFALYQAGRMNQTIVLPEVSAYTIGQLLFFFEMATAYMGELLDIDAFNQPGVENSKVASFAVLGNTSDKIFTDKAQEMQDRPALMTRYIL